MKRVLLFLALAGSASLAAPQPAGKVWRIAYLTGYSVEVDRPLQAAFKQGLRELGYVEGRNISIEARYAGGQPGRMDELARELAAGKPDLFVVGATTAAHAVRRAAKNVPIVMANVQDPVAGGLVKSLARPGGNITGMSDSHAASVTKRLELMREAVPGIKVVGVLWNQDSPSNALQVADLESAAAKIGVKLLSLPVREPAEIDAAVGKLKDQKGAALQVLGDIVFTSNMGKIARLALEHRIPAAYTLRSFVEQGGFMSYGTDFRDLYRRSASFVDKIIKGAKPGDLPIEQPTKFNLILNLKTAKLLGIVLPPAFLVRADDVIR